MNNSCCVSDSSRLHLLTFAKIRHLAGAICTLWSKMVHFRPFWFTLVQDGTLSPLSYMMIACVIYDDRLRHI